MERDYQDIVTAAVVLKRQSGGVVWAEDLAKIISRASPLEPDDRILATQLTLTAIRTGVPVVMCRLGGH